jgi:uncharacterized membrane protein YfcA
MDVATVALAVAAGLAAGVVSGLIGVGGGTLFVPALALLLGLGQVEAEATSLLAIIPVALVGAVRQERYGNLRVKDGMLVGVLSPVGVLVGVLLTHVLSERTLSILFAGVLLLFAFRLGRRALRPE